MNREGRSAAAAIVLAVVLAPWMGPTHADESNIRSQISVAGTGSLIVTPDVAKLTVTVTSTGSSAAAASQENARVTAAVRAALAKTALKPSDVKGTRVTVGPRWEYSEARPPRRSAYEASSVTPIETRELAALGAVIDSGLAAGATEVSDIDFSASNADELRDQALAKAVQSARHEAEVIARANGGRIGELVLMTTGRDEGVHMNMQEIVVSANRRRQADVVPTDVTPSDITISARVEARWEFVPDVAAK